MNTRLDARGRILCALRDCGAAIGFIFEADDTQERIPLVPYGWRPKSGVWRPTVHAAKHYATQGTFTARHAPRWADTPTMKHGRKFVRVYPLPARVACWRCGMVQVLDGSAVRVSTTWRPAGAHADGRVVDPALVVVPRNIAEAKGF